MRRKHPAAKRNHRGHHLRQIRLQEVPTMSTDRFTREPPIQSTSPSDADAEETVRRMVEAAYT